MPLFRYVYTLLDVSEATDQAASGTAYVVVPTETDNVHDHEQEFQVFFDVTQGGGVVGGSVDAVVQTSHDGVNWVEVASIGTPLNADGEKHEFRSAYEVGPLVRAVTVITGDPLPTHTATVVLASTAPFRLQAAT